MKPILRCRNVKVDFDGFKALQGVNLTIDNNEVRFLIGPNGAGKTTMLDVICGKTKATNGEVMFQSEVNLCQLPDYKIVKAGIARKFQNPTVFLQLTVFENFELSYKQRRNLWSVLFAKLENDIHEKMKELLERIGLFHLRHVPAGSLSHGQKQWLEIGMQLMQEPTLLLLDEPIAGMTGAEREKTGELIHDIAKSCSVLIVEHDMEFVRNYSKQITVMHEGKVLCEGTMAKVQENKQVQEVYLGRREKLVNSL